MLPLVALAACTAPASDGADRDPGDPTDTDTGDTVASADAIHLFYMGSDAQGDAGRDEGEHRIFEAHSEDGVVFHEDGLVLTTPAGNDPDIFRTAAGYALFTSVGPAVTLSTSATLDGTYTAQTEFAWNGGGGPSTVTIDGVDRTFMCGAYGINVATLSLSPVGFAPYESALLNPRDTGFICDPSVVQLGPDDYRMFFHWSPSVDSGPWLHELGEATSTDGLHYTALDFVIQVGASVPGAVVRGDVLYLYAVDATGGGDPDVDTGADTGADTGPKIDDTSGLMVGISTDAGLSFSFSPVVLDDAATLKAFDPDPIFVPG